MTKTYPFEVGHRDVWRIALPATLAFITEPIAGLVDLTVIGRLGDAGLLAGLVLGGLAIALLFSLLAFLRLGTAGLTAQAVGARAPDDGLVHLVRAVAIGVVLGLIFILARSPLLALTALYLAPPESALVSFESYFTVRLWSMPFVAINFALLGWFYGRAAATTGMALQLIIHLVNIVLSVWLVYGLGWGVFGVALGTLLGQAFAALVGLILVWRHFGSMQRIFDLLAWEKLTNSVAVKRLFSLSRDLTVRSAALMVAFSYFTAQAARMGDVIVSAQEILIYMLLVSAYFLDGQAQAAEQLSGKAVGANYRPAFERAIKLTTIWGFGIATLLFAIWMVGGGYLIDFISTHIAIREAARMYLWIAALTSITGVAAFVFDGVMQGATMSASIRNNMLIAMALYLVAAIILQPLFGLTGLWLAMHVFFISRGVLCYFSVRRAMPALFPEHAPR